MANPTHAEYSDKSLHYRDCLHSESYIVGLITSYLMRMLDTYRPRVDNPRVLDIGCGTQPLRAFLENRGWLYSGLDVEQRALNVKYICSLESPFPDDLKKSPYDLVICSEVLEHVADWRQSFRNLADSTKPGGRLLLTVPFIYQLHEQPYDFWRPTIYAIRKYASEAGFDLVDESMLGCGWDIFSTLLCACSHPVYIGKRRGAWRIGSLLNYLIKVFERRVIPFLRRRFHLELKGYYMVNGFVFCMPDKQLAASQ